MAKIINQTIFKIKTGDIYVTTTKYTEPDTYFETGDYMVTNEGDVTEFDMFRRAADEQQAGWNHDTLSYIISRVKFYSDKQESI